MKKIAYSLIFILSISIFTFGSTLAFFNDYEASEDNRLEAGGLDIKVDSEAHYRELVCVDEYWVNPEAIDCEDTTIIESQSIEDSSFVAKFFDPSLFLRESSSQKNCQDFGFDYTIAKWNIEDGVYVAEGDPNGTTVTGDGEEAYWTSHELVVGLLRKASTNITVFEGGYEGYVYEYCNENEKCYDISHIEFCGNYEPRCGNGIIELGEECDDGNLIDGDGCDSNCDNECVIYGDIEESAHAAYLHDSTNVTKHVSRSDNYYASQSVWSEQYIYFSWQFPDLPKNIPVTLAELTLEHRESGVAMDVQWYDGNDWVTVCDPAESAVDVIDTCDLQSFINNTDKAGVIGMRLRLTKTGNCHEYLDWAKLKLRWFKEDNCGECGNCILESGEECDNSLNTPEGFYCTNDCKLKPLDPCVGTWEVTDLEMGVHKFFDFSNIKPGDWGEDTISFHVYDNDSWARILVDNIVDFENQCQSAEYFDELGCDQDNDGELLENVYFYAWLDEGEIPGFQNTALEEGDPGYDYGEGDNIKQKSEILFRDTAILDINGEQWNLAPVLQESYLENCDTASTTPSGQNDHGLCHGLSEDGRFVGGTTYYLGVAWEFPLFGGNSTQSDLFSFDLSLEVEQWRHNTDPF